MKQKILHGLLAVLIAFGIWVYVVTVISPESEGTFYNIPVVLTNESVLQAKGLMIASDDVPTVTLQLRGNRTDLNNLKNSDITVTADLSKINAPGDQSLSLSVSFTGAGGDNAFEILNQNPSRVTLQVAEWMTKEVPVTVSYSGVVGQDYIAYKDEVVLDYQNVTLTGPKDVVDQITQAVIEINLDGQVETLSQSYRYTLCNENGEPVDAASITTNVAEVALTLKIQRVKEIQLLLNVTYGGGATAENTTVTMDEQTIKVSGSDKLLDGLDSIVLGSVDLEEILEDTTLEFAVTVPEGVENLSNVTEVFVTVEFSGLAVRTMSISKILVTGLPAGMSYEIGTKKLEVTLRGPADIIAALDPEYISVLVDLSGGTLGEDLYEAKVIVDDSYQNVGVIGSHKVLVTLTEYVEAAGNGTEG